MALALVFLAPLAAADSFNLSETLTSHMILQQAPARAVSLVLLRAAGNVSQISLSYAYILGAHYIL